LFALRAKVRAPDYKFAWKTENCGCVVIAQLTTFHLVAVGALEIGNHFRPTVCVLRLSEKSAASYFDCRNCVVAVEAGETDAIFEVIEICRQPVGS